MDSRCYYISMKLYSGKSADSASLYLFPHLLVLIFAIAVQWNKMWVNRGKSHVTAEIPSNGRLQRNHWTAWCWTLFTASLNAFFVSSSSVHLCGKVLTIMNKATVKGRWFISCMQKLWTCTDDNGYRDNKSCETPDLSRLRCHSHAQTRRQCENSHVEHIR